MKPIKPTNRASLFLALILLIYLAAGIILIPYYRHQINPDGISYISIAQKYLVGNFKDAINGYWSPLLSWLLLPFLYFEIDPLLAAKCITVTAGAITIIAISALSYTFTMSTAIRKTLLLTALFVVISFAFTQVVPDLLTTCLFLFYCKTAFESDYSSKSHRGTLCGILNSFVYFSKSYGMPFFYFHFPLVNLLHYLKNRNHGERKKIILRNFSEGMAVFTLICSLWVIPISIKYGKFVIGTSGTNNFSMMRPTSVTPLGFVAPPNATAISIWEDSTGFLAKGPWTPFESPAALFYWVKIIVHNMYIAIKIFFSFSPFSLLTFIFGVFILTKNRRNLMKKEEVVFSMTTALLFSGGYCLILVDPRYLWPTCCLVLVMGGGMLHILLQNSFFTKSKRFFILALFFISYALLPAHKFGECFNQGTEVFPLPYRYQETEGYQCFQEAENIYALSQQLKQSIVPATRVASDSNFFETLFLGYHLNLQYYGTSENIKSEVLNEELTKHGIDYYLVWHEPGSPYLSLADYTPITEKEFNSHRLAVYIQNRN